MIPLVQFSPSAPGAPRARIEEEERLYRKVHPPAPIIWLWNQVTR